MSILDDVRQTINDIDAKMAELFAKRMEAANEIAAYKSEHGLEIYDEKREKGGRNSSKNVASRFHWHDEDRIISHLKIHTWRKNKV